MSVLTSATSASWATLAVALLTGVFLLFRGRVDGRVALKIAEEAQESARRKDYYDRVEAENVRLRAEVAHAEAEVERYKRIIVKRDAVLSAMDTSFPEVLLREHARFLRAKKRAGHADGLAPAVQAILADAGVTFADISDLDVLKIVTAEEGPPP